MRRLLLGIVVALAVLLPAPQARADLWEVHVVNTDGMGMQTGGRLHSGLGIVATALAVSSDLSEL